MKKWSLIVGLSSSVLTAPVQADTLLGLYLGADGWQTSTSGSFANSTQLQEFSFGDETQTSFYAALEHPLPLLPNIRLRHNQLSADGLTSLTTDFSFAGEDFSAGTELRNEVDLTNTDYVLYYEILDNDLVSLDLGINAKHIDGNLALGTSTDVSAVALQNISVVIPMLYSAVKIGLPLTGLDVFAQGAYVSYDGSRVYDVQAGIAYAFVDSLALNMRVKLGYRAVNLRLDDIDNVYSNLNFKGAFAGVELHF